MQTPGGNALLGTVSFLLLLAACVGCDSRSHDNPLDPLNPDTRGAAPGFNALAGNREVKLVWSDLGLEDIDWVQVLRSPDAAGVETLAVVSPGTEFWFDQNLANGISYDYRVAYSVGGGAALVASNLDTATPGVESVWILDESWGGLWHASPDGWDLTWRSSYGGYFRSLALDAHRDVLWAVSWSREEVLGFDVADVWAPAVRTVIGVDDPRRVAVYEADGSIWVAAEGALMHFDAAGGRVGDYSPMIFDPKDVCVDPARGACWVAEGVGSVFVRHLDGSTLRLPGFDYPFSLAIEGASGDAWLVDAGRRKVYRIRCGVAVVVDSAGGFVQPVDVASAGDGGIWVADWGADAVCRLDPDLERTMTIPGLRRPRSVASLGSGRGCWVVEAHGGTVVKLDEAGERVGWAGGLDFPKDIALGDRSQASPAGRPYPR